MLETIGVLGHTHSLDESMLEPVRRYFADEADASGYETGIPNEFSLLPYRHQLPGGMTGTLKSQLAQHGMEHRLPEVLDEIVLVREDLGQPVMATPFSQLVGIQAVLNIVSGERYKLVPDEVIQYTLSQYGPLMREVQPDIADRILGQPRAADFKGWKRPQPSLRELRQKLGLHLSDEELLLRAMCPDSDVDAMLASGPPRTEPRTKVLRARRQHRRAGPELEVPPPAQHHPPRAIDHAPPTRNDSGPLTPWFTSEARRRR